MSNYTVQRLRGGFAIVYRDAAGKRHRQSLIASDRIGAEAEARQRWRLGSRSDWTVGRIVPAYMDTLKERDAPSHPRAVDAWKAMCSFWENVRPHLIDEAMCKAYNEQRRAGQATRRYELTMLSTAMRWAALKAKVIEVAPHVWRPAAPERKERHLTRDQWRTFFAEVKAPHAQLYMIVALSSCARPSAVLELTWDRVDFARGTLNLNPVGRVQTAKRRPVVPMSDMCRQALQAAYEARQSIYVIERGGKPIANIKKAFEAASKRSSVHATPYTLRHTGAVWKAEDGVPMEELAQLMGHEDVQTTFQHYARFSPQHLRRAANAGAW